jgi:hypothetical protein
VRTPPSRERLRAASRGRYWRSRSAVRGAGDAKRGGIRTVSLRIRARPRTITRPEDDWRHMRDALSPVEVDPPCFFCRRGRTRSDGPARGAGPCGSAGRNREARDAQAPQDPVHGRRASPSNQGDPMGAPFQRLPSPQQDRVRAPAGPNASGRGGAGSSDRRAHLVPRTYRRRSHLYPVVVEHHPCASAGIGTLQPISRTRLTSNCRPRGGSPQLLGTLGALSESI